MIAKKGTLQFEEQESEYYSTTEKIVDVKRFYVMGINWTLINHQYFYLDTAIQLMKIAMHSKNLPTDKMKVSRGVEHRLMYHASPEEIYSIPAIDANIYFLPEAIRRTETDSYTCLGCEYPIEEDLDVCGNCEFPNPLVAGGLI